MTTERNFPAILPSLQSAARPAILGRTKRRAYVAPAYGPTEAALRRQVTNRNNTEASTLSTVIILRS